MNEKRVAIKCDSCGQFHFEDECEEIIIKIVKGKNCPLPNFVSTVSPHAESSHAEERAIPHERKVDVITESEKKEDDVKIEPKDQISVSEKNEILRKNKAIPPVFSTPNGNVDFRKIMRPPEN